VPHQRKEKIPVSRLFQLSYAIWHEIWASFDLYILCLRRKDKYLRKRGARIGFTCDLVTDVINFGTEPYLIRMGNEVTVTSGVKFITHDGSTRLFRKRFPSMNKYGNLFAPIIIGNNCFIGINAILLPGTVLGDDTIVGAGAIVKGEFPSNSVIASVPARRLFSVDEYIDKIQNNMIPLQAKNREALRQELIAHFFKFENS